VDQAGAVLSARGFRSGHEGCDGQGRLDSISFQRQGLCRSDSSLRGANDFDAVASRKIATTPADIRNSLFLQIRAENQA
jgi:hypothetical protein